MEPSPQATKHQEGGNNAGESKPLHCNIYPGDGGASADLKTDILSKKAEHLIRDGFQPRLPTSLPPPGQQQQPSPLPRRQPVPLMPPAQLHTGAPRVVAPAPAVPLQSPPPSELMDVDPSAGPPSQAVAVQPVLQPLSLGTPKESDTAAPCPAPTQQPSTQRQETLPLFVGPDAPSRPVPEAAPVVTGVHPDLGFQSVFPEAPRSQCWGADRRLPPTTVSAPDLRNLPSRTLPPPDSSLKTRSSFISNEPALSPRRPESNNLRIKASSCTGQKSWTLTKNIKPAEIHQLVNIYGEKVDETVC
ncbi:uncharacterized protein LOC126214915 [Schistocerca nitens]|uniref:uncharacterized protein LOC126214915 n=1 Tax=Schistocerca nitens TaxID=7011 RepID=UPI002117C203|nr:uncharacterized protein LOC126214915 [Schistocerca nitens]